MRRIAPDETKRILSERWEAWCDSFTSGNRGRLVDIEVFDAEIGPEPLTEHAALVAIDYDPTDKGNDFVISHGDTATPSRHVISGPVALWQIQDANGLVVSLEIEDQRGGRTVVTLGCSTGARHLTSPRHPPIETSQKCRAPSQERTLDS